MNQNIYLKKGNVSGINIPNGVPSTGLNYPRYFKEEKVSHNMSNSNILIKPPINSREFGKDLTLTNQNQNNSFLGNERKTVNAPNKLMNYFRPVQKNNNEKKVTKLDSSLYNLRPRSNQSLNNSRNNSINTSMNYSTYNNENVNTMNVEVCGGKTKVEVNNQMDVDQVTEKESKLDLTFKSNVNSERECYSTILNKNPQEVSEYLEDIHVYLKSVEPYFLPRPDYMKNQRDLNEKMRGILIDWIVDVHLKFKLLPETLFLTTQIIDRFLDRREISRNKLQLVGVACLFIACKYEEIYPPELKDFVYITDKAYSKTDILQMEYEILNELEFNITHPSSLRFLEIYMQISEIKFDEYISLFSRYLLELFLIEYRMIKYPPSWIAAATLYITIRVKKVNAYWRKIDIPKITGYTEEKLKECAKDICIILDNAEKSSLQAITNKYSSTKFLEVAKWKK